MGNGIETEEEIGARLRGTSSSSASTPSVSPLPAKAFGDPNMGSQPSPPSQEEMMAGVAQVAEPMGISKERGLELANAGSQIMASGQATSMEELEAALYKDSDNHTARAEGLEIAALKAQDGTLSREAAVGAVLTQIFATIAGAAIGGSQGALIGLGAGAVGGGVIAKEGADKQERLAKQYGLQAKQARTDASKAEAGAMKATMQGFSNDEANKRQDKGFTNQNLRDDENNRQKNARAKLVADGKVNPFDEDVQKETIKLWKDKEGDRTNAINRLSSIVDRMAAISPEDKAATGNAITETLYGQIASLLPSSMRGEIEQLKKAGTAVSLATLGEKLSRATEMDASRLAAEVAAEYGNTPEAFEKFLGRFRDLAVITYINDASAFAEQGIMAGASSQNVPSLQDILKKFNYKAVPQVLDRNGKNMYPVAKAVLRNSKGESVIVTDPKQIYRNLTQ